MQKVIGLETIYRGTEFRFMRGLRVRVVRVLRDGSSEDDGLHLETDEDVARAGGVQPGDRIEVQPWVKEEGRYSWVTSDPRAVDLEAFSAS